MKGREHRPAGAAGAVALGLALLSTVAAGCGPEAAKPGREAAAPAVAPATTAAPAGTVVAVPGLAGGMVADERTGLVVVGTAGPPRLAFVDGRTGAVTRSVPLQGTPGQLGLAAAGGPVLVPTRSVDGLVQIALPTGDLVSRTTVGRSPTAATAAANGMIAVANSTGGTVSVVDSERQAAKLGGFARPSVVAASGNQFAVLDAGTATVAVYDAASRRKLASLPAGVGPTSLITDRHQRLLVVDTAGGRLLTYDLTGTPTPKAQQELAGAPYGVAYDATRDRAWVTLTATNEVVAVDLTGPSPRVVSRLPTIRQPDLVAVNAGTGRVFVASPTLGQLEMIDP